MKQIKGFVCMVLALTLIVTCIPTMNLQAKSTSKMEQQIKLKKTKVSLGIGQKSQIYVLNAGKAAKISYKSKNAKIISVTKKGKVTALKTGKTKVVVTVKNGKSSKKLIYTVSVKKPVISCKNAVITTGKTKSFSIKNKPKTAKYKWYLKNKSLAKLTASGSKCKLKALKAGKTKLYVNVRIGKKTYKLTSNITIEKKKTKTYTVRFETNGGSSIKSQKIKAGKNAIEPDIPTKTGYKFIGWFINKNEKDWKNSYKFDTPVNADITLNAIWVDLTTDTDKDGLSDALEDYCKTDKTKADTDSDGLTDYQEITELGTNPLKIDTDANGVSDFDEDFDKDDLSNGNEFILGTSPVNEDSDGDGLKDGEEIKKYKTSPIKEDTDNDGAEDGWEVFNSFNPCEFNATFEVTAKSEEISDANPVAASVELDITGDQVTTLDVAPVSVYDNPLASDAIPGSLGKAYDFHVDGTINSAELTFTYDTSLGTISNDFQPRVYYLNEETGCLQELENQTVENGKVCVTTSHFSTYILLNKVEFDKVWATEIKPPMINDDGSEASIDVAIVIDYSASMVDNDKYQTFKILSKNFISKLRDNVDQAAIVKFIARATLVQGLTSDKNSLNTAIDSITYDNGWGSYSGTNGSDGYNMALNVLKESNAEHKYIIFITDGEDNRHSYDYNDLIIESVKMGVTAYTIGMGNASEEVLTMLANGTNGKYYHATTETSKEELQLNEVFEKIEQETVDLTKDFNNDGIPDYYNDMIREGKLRLSNGVTAFSGIDFNYDQNGNISDDYDGDGLKNGEELKIVTNGDLVYLHMISDPMLIHSDGDAIDDKTEIQQGTNPLKMQLSKQNTDYLTNDENFMYSRAVNDYDNDWFWKIDTGFLATVFGVWNKDEIYRDIYIDYFKDYSNVDYLESLQAEDAKKTMVESLSSWLTNLGNGVLDVAETPTNVYDEINNIKKLISELNGTKDPKQIHYLLIHSYKEIMEEIMSIDPKLGTINISSYHMRSETITTINLTAAKSKAFDCISNGVSIIGYGVDATDTIWQVSKVSANQQAFEQNIDILKTLRDYAKDDHAVDAANAVITALSDGIKSATVGLVGDGLEAAADILIGIASENIYVLAVVIARDGIDLITGISIDIEQQYQMLSYERLDEAVKFLLKHSLTESSNYYKCKTDSEKDVNRYLVNLAQIRILGEETFAEWVKDEGLLGAFDDNSKVETIVANKVKFIKQLISTFGLQVATSL